MDGRRRAARGRAARRKGAARLSGGSARARRSFDDGRRRSGAGGCFVNLPRPAPRRRLVAKHARAGRGRGRRRRRPRSGGGRRKLPVNRPSLGYFSFFDGSILPRSCGCGRAARSQQNGFSSAIVLRRSNSPFPARVAEVIRSLEQRLEYLRCSRASLKHGECSICLEAHGRRRRGARACGHRFHAACLAQMAGAAARHDTTRPRRVDGLAGRASNFSPVAALRSRGGQQWWPTTAFSPAASSTTRRHRAAKKQRAARRAAFGSGKREGVQAR